MTDQKPIDNPLRSRLFCGAPAIAVSYADAVPAGVIARAVADELDVAELRIDRYGSLDAAHVIETAQQFSRLPTLATIRIAGEGGEWNGDDTARASLLRSVLPHVDGIDIELASLSGALAEVAAEARELGKVLVVSHHDFDRTPTGDALAELIHEAKSRGADVAKVSTMTHSPDDVRTLAQVTIDHVAQQLIVVGMGVHGTASRIFLPTLGSLLTFAYATHPVSGQLSFAETFRALRQFSPEFDQLKTVQL